MKCKNCGASLLDTDQFCDQCGWKVVKERRCPECNAPLREGTKFCPKCGRMINAAGSADEGKVYMRDAETTDIPIGDIEQNILFETEREIHKSEAGKKANKAARAPKEGREVKENRAVKTDRVSGERAAQTIEREVYKKKPHPAPEPKRREKPVPVKKRQYEEWDDEEEDDDDEEEDEDEGFSFITIVSVFMAFVILAVAVFLIFSMRQNRSARDYEETEQESTVGEEDTQEGETENEAENGSNNQVEIGETDGIQAVGTLVVTTDVNVRDNPSTEGTNVIKVAKEGEIYEYVGTTQDGSWYEIILDGVSTGYVSGKFVSVQ